MRFSNIAMMAIGLFLVPTVVNGQSELRITEDRPTAQAIVPQNSQQLKLPFSEKLKVGEPPILPSPISSPPLPTPSPKVPSTGLPEKGITNPRTGEYYPGTYGGVINPQSGAFLPKVDGGYVNPRTGEFFPAK
jgi:hypothetical protein